MSDKAERDYFPHCSKKRIKVFQSLGKKGNYSSLTSLGNNHGIFQNELINNEMIPASFTKNAT